MNKNYFVVYSIAVLIRPIGYFGLWPLVGPSRTSSLEMYLRIKNACGLEILEWSLISILDGISSKTSLESFVYPVVESGSFHSKIIFFDVHKFFYRRNNLGQQVNFVKMFEICPDFEQLIFRGNLFRSVISMFGPIFEPFNFG